MEPSSHQIFTFPNDPISYEVVRWHELTDLIFIIAQQVKEQGLEFDRIISLAKGGWPMARTLADFLGIREASSIGTRLYNGIGQVSEKVEIYQDLHDVSNERLLLIDDVSDTGKTLQHVLKHMEKSQAASLHTATVYFKPHSVCKPDFYSKETTHWIIFPYEVIESALELQQKWQDSGVSKSEIIERLDQIGCKKEWRTFLGIEAD